MIFNKIKLRMSNVFHESKIAEIDKFIKFLKVK